MLVSVTVTPLKASACLRAALALEYGCAGRRFADAWTTQVNSLARTDQLFFFYSKKK